MILKILIYFFLIFGIADFIHMLWITTCKTKNNSKSIFMFVPYKEVKENLNETIRVLKNFPYKIYFLTTNEEEIEINTLKSLVNAQTVTLEQLTEEIIENYGNNNRKC